MFRPIAATIRFSFESMVVTLIGLVWLFHDGEISTAVMFPIYYTLIYQQNCILFYFIKNNTLK